MKVYFINKKMILWLIFSIFILLVFYIYFSIFKTSNTISDTQNSSNNLYKKLIELYSNEKIAFLTFDDGPNVSVTPKVLDILKEENVKASFFVIGKCVDANPEITKRAYDEGHYIANHGYSHNNNLLYKSSDNFLNEVKKTDLAIGNAIGVSDYCSHLFRFPNGFMSPSNKSKKKEAVKLLQDIEYNYIDWNCLNNDSIKKYSSSQLLNNLIKSSKNKDILVILMHDTKDVSNSSLVLKDSIKYLKGKGYVFKNFYDIMPNILIMK
ncbi:MAG: hypothetical protein BHV99_03905 [Clostridium sp. 26_21]|nr:MAG: hypothetical protein BHV99_03905 [Clostridium sp. 26_21]